MRYALTLVLTVFATTATLPAPARAQGEAAKQPDITGKWAFSVVTEFGSGSPTVTFKQKGDTLSGHYSSQGLGEHDFTGTFKDGKIEFSFNSDVEGQPFSVTFHGTMDGADAMKGSLDLAGMSNGTFTGKRQKP
jgi:hypothetical protein